MKYTQILFVFSFLLSQASAQDSLVIRRIYDEALLRGQAYENLRQLCKDIGPRLSGSAQAQMAVDWSYEKMRAYQFDNPGVQWIESRGWISREFRVRAPEAVHADLLALIARLDAKAEGRVAGEEQGLASSPANPSSPIEEA